MVLLPSPTNHVTLSFANPHQRSGKTLVEAQDRYRVLSDCPSDDLERVGYYVSSVARWRGVRDDKDSDVGLRRLQ